MISGWNLKRIHGVGVIHHWKGSITLRKTKRYSKTIRCWIQILKQVVVGLGPKNPSQGQQAYRPAAALMRKAHRMRCLVGQHIPPH